MFDLWARVQQNPIFIVAAFNFKKRSWWISYRLDFNLICGLGRTWIYFSFAIIYPELGFFSVRFSSFFILLKIIFFLIQYIDYSFSYFYSSRVFHHLRCLPDLLLFWQRDSKTHHLAWHEESVCVCINTYTFLCEYSLSHSFTKVKF